MPAAAQVPVLGTRLLRRLIDDAVAAALRETEGEVLPQIRAMPAPRSLFAPDPLAPTRGYDAP